MSPELQAAQEAYENLPNIPEEQHAKIIETYIAAIKADPEVRAFCAAIDEDI